DHLPALHQRRDHPTSLALASHRERQRDALEARVPAASTVRSQHGGLADLEAGMHRLVLGTWLSHPGVGAFLEALEGRDLGADRATVELERLLAAPLEEQVGLNLHRRWHRHDSLRLLLCAFGEPGSVALSP